MLRKELFSLLASRVQDIRATEKDKVQVYRSFRPGDIVRAQVISLGDARSYYLATTKNDLGVIFARSEAGQCCLLLFNAQQQRIIYPKNRCCDGSNLMAGDAVPKN